MEKAQAIEVIIPLKGFIRIHTYSDSRFVYLIKGLTHIHKCNLYFVLLIEATISSEKYMSNHTVHKCKPISQRQNQRAVENSNLFFRHH